MQNHTLSRLMTNLGYLLLAGVALGSLAACSSDDAPSTNGGEAGSGTDAAGGNPSTGGSDGSGGEGASGGNAGGGSGGTPATGGNAGTGGDGGAEPAGGSAGRGGSDPAGGNGGDGGTAGGNEGGSGAVGGGGGHGGGSHAGAGGEGSTGGAGGGSGGVDAGSGGSGGEAGSGGSEECGCLNDELGWGPQGAAVVSYRDHGSLSGCDDFQLTRHYMLFPQPDRVCTSQLTDCSTMIGVPDLLEALADPEVQQAAAMAPMSYGYRAPDAGFFRIQIGSAILELAEPCGDAKACIDAPEGLLRLRGLLNDLMQEQREQQACASVLG